MHVPRIRHTTVSAEDIDTLQRQEDQITEAGQFMTDTYTDLRYNAVHPWRASNRILLSMGYAAVALCNDRLAEALRVSGVVSRHRDRLTPDTAYFAVQLTAEAMRAMREGVQKMPADAYVDFDKPTMQSLRPEAMMPYWPRIKPERISGVPLFREQDTQSWMGKDMPYATARLLLGTVAAARTIHSDMNSALNDLNSVHETVAPIPPQFADFTDKLRDYATRAVPDLNFVEDNVDADADGAPLTGRAMTETYLRAHDAYISMAEAYVAVACPPSVGEQYIPQLN